MPVNLKREKYKKKKEIGGFFKIMILFDFEFVCLIFFYFGGGMGEVRKLCAMDSSWRIL